MSRSRLVRRFLTLVPAAIVVAGTWGLNTSAAHAANGTVVLEPSATTVMAGDSITLTVTVADEGGAPVPFGHVEIRNWGSIIFDGTTDATGVATTTWAVPFGASSLVARYLHASFTVDSTDALIIGQGTSTTTLTLVTANPIEDKPLAVHASIWNNGANAQGNYGTVNVRHVETDTIVASKLLDGEPEDIKIEAGLPAGTQHLVAEFPGIDTTVLPSTSDPLEVTVGEDTILEAETPTLEGTKIYPVKDDYLDTIRTLGMMNEPGSVKVEVWRVSTNTKVRTLDLGTSGIADTFPYQAVWNGRNSAGTILASGSYKFIHRLTDLQGNTKSFTTAPFSLSQKKLYWTTLSTSQKTGSSYWAKGTGGNGSVSAAKSSFTGGLRIARGSAGFAQVAYKFTLSTVTTPSSAVVKRVVFYVYGKGLSSGRADIGIHNETLGEPLDAGSYDTWKTTSSSYAWHNTATNKYGSHLVGRTVYGIVDAIGTFDINDVKVVYKYAVLK